MTKRKQPFGVTVALVALGTVLTGTAGGLGGFYWFEIPFWFGFTVMTVFAGLIGLFVLASATTDISRKR